MTKASLTLENSFSSVERPEKFDLAIVGGGPAGATCALVLRDSGLKILLLDKSRFPREKTCGDAIGGRSIKTLEAVCPELIKAFRGFEKKTLTTKTRLSINERSPFEVHWVNEAFVCRRVDFDHFLLENVKKSSSNLTVVENFAVDFVQKQEGPSGSFLLGSKANGVFFEAKMIVGADGAQSVVAKKTTETRLSQRDHAGAVRAYFRDVGGLADNTTEIFSSKKCSPGYLWIFPNGGGLANVGFGMLTREISERKINLRQMLFEFIDSSPSLRDRFSGAEQVGKVEGFGLPLGSRRVEISGDGFLLAGDAASLIDPLSGDGIGNAITSGKVAAETVLQAFEKSDFSATFLKSYDRRLFKIIGLELRKKTFALRVFSAAPNLIDVGARLMNIPFILKLVKKLA